MKNMLSIYSTQPIFCSLQNKKIDIIVTMQITTYGTPTQNMHHKSRYGWIPDGGSTFDHNLSSSSG